MDDLGPGHDIVQESIRVARKLDKLRAKIYINWLPSHSGIPGNENADRIAKRAALNKQLTLYKVSLTNIRRKLNRSIIDKWQKDWDQNKNKGRQYEQLRPKISRKAIKSITDRRTWTAYIQLKLGHGYFRSYLYRLSKSETNRCTGNCRGIQSPIHLYLSCQHYRAEQKELKNKLEGVSSQNITLADIYSEKNREVVYNYLKKTRIATKEWLQGQEEGEEEIEV
jgi:hypothetical protein